MESKHLLLMKIDQFMSYYKRKKFVKKFYKIPQVPGPFVFTKNLVQLHWKMKFLKQATYIRYILAKLSKPVQITKHTSSYFFTEDYLKIKKGLELVSNPYFLQNFLIIFFF